VLGYVGFPSIGRPWFCSRSAGLREALSAATIAPEISSRNTRVAALQRRWDRLRAGLGLILDQRGANMADLPGGASGMLCRDYKRKEADREVYHIDPGVVPLVAELRGHERQTAEELEQRAEVDVPAKRVPLILARHQRAEQGETRPCFRDAGTAICDVVLAGTREKEKGCLWEEELVPSSSARLGWFSEAAAGEPAIATSKTAAA
jgi:hypothetical protein